MLAAAWLDQAVAGLCVDRLGVVVGPALAFGGGGLGKQPFVYCTTKFPLVEPSPGVCLFHSDNGIIQLRPSRQTGAQQGVGRAWQGIEYVRHRGGEGRKQDQAIVRRVSFNHGFQAVGA